MDKPRCTISALLLAVGLNTACALPTTHKNHSEDRRMAIQRWHECLDRHTPDVGLRTKAAARIIEQDCEGYKRDVLAFFPRHLENQVEHTLVSSAYRKLNELDRESGQPMPELPAKTVLR